MTGFAFKILKFILYKCCLLDLLFLVALVAGHVSVVAIKHKPCFIMVKGSNFPVIKLVTSFAIGGSVSFKLIIMFVGVAIYTGSFHTRKPLLLLAGIIFWKMTCFTVLLLVSAQKFKFCFWMVEIYFFPWVNNMAIFTFSFRVKFCIDFILVDVLVTIVAADSDFPETPFFLLFMAFKTRCCNVGAF